MCLIVKYVYLSLSFLSSFGSHWQYIVVPPEHVEPDFAAIPIGGSLTLYCGSTSQVNWTHLGPNGDYILSNSGSTQKYIIGYAQLKLLDLDKAGAGVYTCHGAINGTPFTCGAYVAAKKRLFYTELIPTWADVPLNGTVTLTCGSSKRADWFGVHIHEQNKIIGFNTLTLLNLQRKHSGMYACRGVFPGQGHKNIFHSFTRIIVNGYVITPAGIPN